jgi:hypothetical protein
MQNLTTSDILALIDELNQYQIGNVTKLGLTIALQEALDILNSK